MAHRGGDAAPAGFTVVYCDGQHCRSRLPIRERLAAAVRSCPQGMLIGSACLFGPQGCPGKSSAAMPGSPLLLVQRCVGASRRPIGPALTLGPLRTSADLEALCGWLDDPAARLPIELDQRRWQGAARFN